MPTPTRVASLAQLRGVGEPEVHCVGVACAAYTTAVVLSSGTVYTMGGRAEGAATAESLAMPKPLELPEGATAIAGSPRQATHPPPLPPPAAQPPCASSLAPQAADTTSRLW